MEQVRTGPKLLRLQEYDLALCIACNRAAVNAEVRRFFSAVSRLGDGLFWYAVIALLPVVYGRPGLHASLNMALTGAVAVAVYKVLKHRTTRPRPFAVSPAVRRATQPLDNYSFPSGHTLHAVAFTLTAGAHHPELTLVLAPFALLVAVSRLVLGLHYPSDVIAGAGIGAALGYALLFV